MPMADLDALGMRRIVDYLSSDTVHVGLAEAGEQAAEEVAKIDEQLAKERAELANLKARVKARELSIDFAATVEPGILEQLAELTRRREELTTPSELRGLTGSREDVEARLAGIDDITRLRRIAQVVLSRPMAGEMRVKRSPSRGHRVPVGDRTVFRFSRETRRQVD